MIPKPRPIADMRNDAVGIPGQVRATRLTDGNVKLAHQFYIGGRAITGATCVLSPGAAKALAEGIVSLLEE